MRRTISAISAFALVTATSAPAMAATCDTSLSSGVASTETSYAKVELKGYTTGATSFEIWLTPKDSNCISQSSTSTAPRYVNMSVKGQGDWPVSLVPQCDISKRTTNTSTGGAAVARAPANGEAASGGNTQFIGRTPFIVKYSWGYSDAHLDYRLLVDSTGKFVSFCISGVSGAFTGGSSEFWRYGQSSVFYN